MLSTQLHSKQPLVVTGDIFLYLLSFTSYAHPDEGWLKGETSTCGYADLYHYSVSCVCDTTGLLRDS